jgi:hypothetical protein
MKIETEDIETFRHLRLSFKTASKYRQLYNELKHALDITVDLNPRIYKHHKQYSDGLGRLYRQDLDFREYCMLAYGEPLKFYSHHDTELNTIQIRLVSSIEYQNLTAHKIKSNLGRFI